MDINAFTAKCKGLLKLISCNFKDWAILIREEVNPLNECYVKYRVNNVEPPNCNFFPLGRPDTKVENKKIECEIKNRANLEIYLNTGWVFIVLYLYLGKVFQVLLFYSLAKGENPQPTTTTKKKHHQKKTFNSLRLLINNCMLNKPELNKYLTSSQSVPEVNGLSSELLCTDTRSFTHGIHTQNTLLGV